MAKRFHNSRERVDKEAPEHRPDASKALGVAPGAYSKGSDRENPPFCGVEPPSHDLGRRATYGAGIFGGHGACRGWLVPDSWPKTWDGGTVTP